MAEIPIEKKSGMGWLWALLALLIIGLLAWWLISAADDDKAVNYTGAETAAVVPAVPMATATAGTMEIGQSVDLDNVRVTSLAGDMAFNAVVNGQEMLVLFNQEPTPNDATEGEYDINLGSIVNIDGSIRSATAPLPDGVTAEIPSGTDRYIFADSIEMVS